MELNLEQIKVAALAVTPGRWEAYGTIVRDVDGGEDQLAQGRDFEHARYIAAANPVVVIELIERLERAEARGDAALDMAFRYGGIDGEHHKTWVIDQMCRALLGEGYDAWVAEAKVGEDGPETNEWDVGVAP
ncbi:hypothetical protein [Cupriavidus sp. IDO]|uniref:hypothetical protein n=1 Tax=Cupriavidus sp. IDO TaxID=1539142 RepID=UPI00068CC7EF|nr:hypothetical protein [Cupriavidus sp. IDO]KWR88786.1 hypothetical protein RM96_17890 [Cupriavidus sp. IDO]